MATYDSDKMDVLFNGYNPPATTFFTVPPGSSKYGDIIYNADKEQRADKPVFIAIWALDPVASPPVIQSSAGLLMPAKGTYKLGTIIDKLDTVEFEHVTHEIMAFAKIPDFDGYVFETPNRYLICPQRTRVNNSPSILPELGGKVQIWDGDGEKYLGEGEFVGTTTVYAVRTPRGLQSLRNAEERPNMSAMPEGSVLVEIENNPKFRLKNGNTVYACQVWWKPME